MARRQDTGTIKSRIVTLVGRRRVGEEGREELVVEIDGRSTSTWHNRATHNEATYVATVKAMRRADREGVTDLTINCSNDLVEGHMIRNWDRKEKRFHPFQKDIANLIAKFDDVDWL